MSLERHLGMDGTKECTFRWCEKYLLICLVTYMCVLLTYCYVRILCMSKSNSRNAKPLWAYAQGAKIAPLVEVWPYYRRGRQSQGRGWGIKKAALPMEWQGGEAIYESGLQHSLKDFCRSSTYWFLPQANTWHTLRCEQVLPA